jgi:hypothetical protein
MENGTIVVTLQPKELVTLRGAAGTGETRAVSTPRKTQAALRPPYVRSDGTLAIPIPPDPGIRMCIVDVAGRMVRGRRPVRASESLLLIPSGTLPPGVYLVRLAGHGAGTTTRVVLKR